jgi:hypothetical protein
MDSLNLLKQEINQTLEAEHDFAKWKLLVAAALGATALGLDKGGTPHYSLLLFIPFVCAYIDIHLYQYQARILVLAQFIRDYHPPLALPDTVLQDYESRVAGLRTKHIFDLGQYANFAASIGLSIVAGLPLAASWWSGESTNVNKWVALAIWGVGIVLIFILRVHHRSRLKVLAPEQV